MEVPRSQKDVCEELTERSGGGTEIGQQLDRGGTVQKAELALLDSDSLHLAQWSKER